MTSLQHVPIEPISLDRFATVLEPAEYEALLELVDRGARELRGRAIWNVNSTAKGGGVVELLRPLLGYSRGGGVDARWVVIPGDPAFFDLTKRIHNNLHGYEGDGGGLGAPERELYERTLAGSAAELAELLSPRDVVILHDPQTAGLVPAVRASGALTVWRCHVGLDHPNDCARAAWDFLRDYVAPADAYVFSRESFAWEGLAKDRIIVIQPTIDAFSPKNAAQSAEQTLAILAAAGIVAGDATAPATFTRSDDTPGRIDRRAQLVEVGPLAPVDRMVLQVSRWDRLKDPLGVINAFVEHVAPHEDAHLMLAGPSTESVADDPEGAAVYAAVRDAFAACGDGIRDRVHLASLPMQDTDENAAIVNALQRHATVVVQKSIAEGFGLTVAEALWKARPMVASRIGGIQDQIVDGESGLLLDDPRDLTTFGALVLRLLRDSDLAARIGSAAHTRVRDRFLGPHSLANYFALIERLTAARASSERAA
jgi:trehalose synthase